MPHENTRLEKGNTGELEEFFLGLKKINFTSILEGDKALLGRVVQYRSLFL